MLLTRLNTKDNMRMLLCILSIAYSPYLSANTEADETSTEIDTTINSQNRDHWLDQIHFEFSDALDGSASWLDSKFDSDIQIDQQAKAWARVQVGVQPKSGDWSHFPVRFRIKVRLPNLEERVDLILSDNELDDLERLPLETSRPNDNISNSDDFSAALRLVHNQSDDSFFSSRIGFGRGTVFARSYYRWQTQLNENWSFLLQPAVEYWAKDGFGARNLSQVSYHFSKDAEIRFSQNIWYIDDFDQAHWKQGIYYLQHLEGQDAFVAGFLMEGRVKPKFEEEKMTLSVRYRKQVLREWLFFEVEPFVDFEEQNDFNSSFGIALRLEGYFGYLN